MNDLANRLPDLPLVLGPLPYGMRRAIAQEGAPAVDWRPGVAGRFVLYDSAVGAAPACDRRQTTIDVRTLPGYESAMIALEDESSVRSRWEIDDWAVHETIARHDARAARRSLIDALSARITTLGGVWMTVSPYPWPYRTAFNLRLDYDDLVRSDFTATQTAIAGFEHAVSHYLCASSFVGARELLARLEGQDVGSHGFYHHTYRDPAENLRNIRRGIEALTAEGLEPHGFVAPHGRYPAGFGEVLSELNIGHSSEFALAYDDAPFFPRGSNVLQIPVHPVCLGIFFDAAREMGWSNVDAVAAAERHLTNVALEHHRACEPIFVYGHPDGRLGRYPSLIRRLMAVVSSLDGVWMTTMAEFARWWRARSAARIEVFSLGNRVVVRMDFHGANFRFALQRADDGKRASAALSSGVTTLGESDWTYEPIALPRTPKPVPAPQPATWRQCVREWLDWEHVTPPREIMARRPRGAVKRVLRHALWARVARLSRKEQNA